MHAVLQSIRKEEPAVLRRDLRTTEHEPGILLRRAIVGGSLIGIACMAITTLFQTGMVRHLPDPPIEGFDSDKVNASDLAYGWGMPDSPLSIGSHAAAIALAGAGGADRADSKPLLPLAATAAAVPAALTAARYLFHDMPVREKGWCPYCIVDALTHLAVLGFTLWESKKAIDRLRSA
ncbi:MAG: vitamin K epoxide reductase family protein [Betaproteobacteria bacterium]